MRSSEPLTCPLCGDTLVIEVVANLEAGELAVDTRDVTEHLRLIHAPIREPWTPNRPTRFEN